MRALDLDTSNIVQKTHDRVDFVSRAMPGVGRLWYERNKLQTTCWYQM